VISTVYNVVIATEVSVKKWLDENTQECSGGGNVTTGVDG
jgi:hypothetical protein